ncbi:hypothetical protein MicvaDRAFT_0076 [Microcoleus vaginatus FGP-2]|nr:hypothetical protein MicvaDRAFT_0076 [Microcoleus vaginatus FGP-2]
MIIIADYKDLAIKSNIQVRLAITYDSCISIITLLLGQD